MSADEEIPTREVAYRLFAAEYDDASLSHTESDEERAPNYVVSPIGARLNRVFVTGTLTEVSPVNDEMLRARVVDPTGAFVVYAGQYQPDELATLEQLEPPAFVAVTGKARTFEPEDGDRVFTSIRPESIATVDGDTRDRWVVTAAEQTLERVGTYAAAAAVDAEASERQTALEEAGVDPALAAGIPLAMDHYGTTPAYLAAVRDQALAAAKTVVGEREEVPELAVAPGGQTAAFDTTFEALADEDLLATLRSALADDEPTGESISTDRSDVTAHSPPDTRAGAATTTSTADASETATTETTLTGASDDAEPSASETSDKQGAETAAQTDTAAVDESAPDTDPGSETDDTARDGSDSQEETETADESIAEVGMYEMDDEEREQLEAKFGAEFSTGAEVENSQMTTETDSTDDLGAPPTSTVTDSPPASEPTGETPSDPESVDADLETAATAEVTDSPDDEDGATDKTDDGTDDEDASADDGEDTDTTADEVDIQTLVVETMQSLDDGDGADRTAVIEAVASDAGVDEAAVEDAIQEALMGGQCYEPGEGMLKAI